MTKQKEKTKTLCKQDLDVWTYKNNFMWDFLVLLILDFRLKQIYVYIYFLCNVGQQNVIIIWQMSNNSDIQMV